MSEVQTRKVNKEMKVRLSVAELAKLGEENGELVGERDQIMKELTDYTKPRKSRLKEIEKRRDEIAIAQQDKETVQMVECEMRLDFNSGSVEYWSLDGKEKLEERSMDDSERQIKMFNDSRSVSEMADEMEDEEGSPEDIADVMAEEKSKKKKRDLTTGHHA